MIISKQKTLLLTALYSVKVKGKAIIFIHGLCLKLQACGAVYMKQVLQIEQKFC